LFAFREFTGGFPDPERYLVGGVIEPSGADSFLKVEILVDNFSNRNAGERRRLSTAGSIQLPSGRVSPAGRQRIKSCGGHGNEFSNAQSRTPYDLRRGVNVTTSPLSW